MAQLLDTVQAAIIDPTKVERVRAHREKAMRASRFLGALVLSSVAIVGAPTCVLSQGSDSALPAAPGGARDSWMTAKAKIALFADRRIEGRHITVATADGTVTLRGKVDSAEVKAAAGSLAKAIDGVKSVTNDLRVAPAVGRPAFAPSDEDITREVEGRFSRDGQLRSVGVRTDNGVVVLTGNVPSIAASARASERAHGVPGARSVRNQLTYDAPMPNR